MRVQQPRRILRANSPTPKEQTSQLIDWFAEGQTLAVEFANVVVPVRYP